MMGVIQMHFFTLSDSETRLISVTIGLDLSEDLNIIFIFIQALNRKVIFRPPVMPDGL